MATEKSKEYYVIHLAEIAEKAKTVLLAKNFWEDDEYMIFLVENVLLDDGTLFTVGKTMSFFTPYVLLKKSTQTSAPLNNVEGSIKRKELDKVYERSIDYFTKTSIKKVSEAFRKRFIKI